MSTPLKLYIQHSDYEKNLKTYDNKYGKSCGFNLSAVSVCAYSENGFDEFTEAFSSKAKKEKMIDNAYRNRILGALRNSNGRIVEVYIPSAVAKRKPIKKFVAKKRDVKIITTDNMDDLFVQYLLQSAKIKAEVMYSDSFQHMYKVAGHGGDFSYELRKKLAIPCNIYTDGSINEKSKYGYAVCVNEDGTMYRKRVTQAVSSNKAESHAIMLAIEKFATPSLHLIIHTDSEYAMHHILRWNKNAKDSKTDGYALGRTVHEAIERGCIITVKKVQAHSDNAGNNAADKIAHASMAYDKNASPKKCPAVSFADTVATAINTMLMHTGQGENHKIILSDNSAYVIPHESQAIFG